MSECVQTCDCYYILLLHRYKSGLLEKVDVVFIGNNHSDKSMYSSEIA